MSQADNQNGDELQPEYDFSRGVRSKHHAAYKKGTNVVLLDPDVAQLFPDSRAVNEAPRASPDSEATETRVAVRT